MSRSENEPPRFILLLPPAPTASDSDLINGVYGDSLRQVLKEVALASREHEKAAILEIALACPHLVSQTDGKPFSRYDETQRVLAQTYRLACIIAARDKINVEDTDGVDMRVLLVAWDERSSGQPKPSGMIPSLGDLAASQRQWQYAFGVENEAGEAMVRAFVQAKNGASKSTNTSDAQIGQAYSRQSPQGRIPCVAVGGTFDHLHIGHKLLLTMTVFAVLDKEIDTRTDRSVIVGITIDDLLKNKKFAEHLESWHDRQKAVFDFVEAIVDFGPSGSQAPSSKEVSSPGPNGHAINTSFFNGLYLRCVEIGDPFGPTITERDIDALIISAETRSGGKAVNDKRVEQGWHLLEVLEVDVLDAGESTDATSNATQAQDFAGKISSTEIRRKLTNKGHPSVL
ncbi:phosphopantetheine adenylyltransferase-like protein [Elsinoe australis]|uniref:Phosphopantetheine adenylyltransferase-like protein n=1 Tax=Elsinoe australis TaxID=40998 RepID=A0A4U7AKA8_9PEZI|nr:phosphopantetheine adenylyltransferase-like protein [Elsinoe australis]